MENGPWYNGVISKLFGMKYLAFIVSLLLLVTGILAVALGIKNIIDSAPELLGHKSADSGPHLLEAVDTFLFSLVTLILSGGIYKLFVGNADTFKHISVFAKLKSFKDLKVLLWETILLALTVTAALNFFLDEDYSYEQLILPAGILILALALRVVKGGNLFSKNDEH
jgi:uncharacterized membrane protein YqhA